LVDAVTRYRLEAWLGPFSLLTVRPETGRKHQIRRHLQTIGHAVVGDDRYPPRRFRKVPGFPGRLWLHANELTLPDGRRFRAPLAAELDDHLRLLLEMNEGAPLDITEPEEDELDEGPSVEQIGPGLVE
jgi:23S rRNA pseudouridine955/2504/2580 synthase